ncbi:MAG: hypothetical protein ACKO0Z_14770, partial [Betaproteobacteria bacterium]
MASGFKELDLSTWFSRDGSAAYWFSPELTPVIPVVLEGAATSVVTATGDVTFYVAPLASTPMFIPGGGYTQQSGYVAGLGYTSEPPPTADLAGD